MGLPPALLKRIKVNYDNVAHYVYTTLEELEIGFMRDLHPEREVAVWETDAQAWDLYQKRHVNNKRLTKDQKKQLVVTLVGISMGVIEHKDSPEVVNRNLFECWRQCRMRRVQKITITKK